MSKSFGSFKEFFETIKVDDLKSNVITISSNESLEEGFTKLATNSILSAPVYDEVEKKYVGFLDMRDLVSSVVFIVDQSVEWEKTKSVKDLMVNAKWIGGTYTVTYLSRRNKFQSIKLGSNLFEVVTLMGNGKVKRVPIVDEKENIVGIISQSTIINLIHKNLSHIKDPRLHQTVAEIKLASSPCVSVNQSEKTIDVFRKMDSNSFSGVAFVDDEGKLVGNISSRDIKAFIKSIDFNLLNTPVGEFIKVLRLAIIDISHPTINCFNKATFSFILEKLSATKVHRMFVVDGEEKFRPTGVISLQDALSHML